MYFTHSISDYSYIKNREKISNFFSEINTLEHQETDYQSKSRTPEDFG